MYERIASASGDVFMENGTGFADIVNVHKSFSWLASRKGAGGDGVSAELLRAGGWQTAQLYSRANVGILTDGWPLRWRGERLALLWKKKGARTECDIYCGLTLQGHSAKAAAG